MAISSDYYESQVHSPTDSSEDSVEVKISAISVRNLNLNKRKCHEPRKLQETFTGPLKKRMCLKVKAESACSDNNAPFRPWSPDNSINHQDEPVSLVMTPKPSDLRVPPLHPDDTKSQSESFQAPRREQRNYKNMTRERRIEANARERTRVHTISAAFDTLRKAIPSYSHNQKLSKLSVLRIACSYIMTLSSIVSDDDANSDVTADCVELVTKTIQREGKLRKKKDDND